MPKVSEELKNSKGKYPTNSYIGLYPLYYFSESTGQVWCADCASQQDAEPPITHYDIHWEGESLYCDGCSNTIESAYGIPEEE